MGQNSGTFHVIWGAGALGTLLAWDLRQLSSQEFLLVGRQSSIATPHVRLNNQTDPFEQARGRYFACNSKGLSSRLAGANALLFYFCVPPQSIDEAVSAVQIQLQNLAPKEVIFVFCQNGLLESHQWLALTHTLPSDTKVSVVRALLYLGAQRLWENGIATIYHRGGNQARFEPLIGSPSVGLFPAKSELLQWKKESGMEAQELAKLFINTLLFAMNENQHQNNGEILSALEGNRLEAFAHAFAAVTGTSALLPEHLITLFRETAAATAPNLNSISFAWRNGDKTTWGYFKKTLTRLMHISDNAAAALELERLLEATPSWKEDV